MQLSETAFAVLLGLVQGALEWLPVSSEGSLALLAAVVLDETAVTATQLGLFLHVGTAAAALAFYRADIADLLGQIPSWRPRDAFDHDRADLTFYAIATLVSGIVGISIYIALAEAASELAGGGFVAAIGVLLVLTGLVQRAADRWGLGDRTTPEAVDAVLVGAMQGLALLPGVSRSGTTVSALLLRGYDGDRALQLSFLLSIPASLGAGVLVFVDDGFPAVSATTAAIALATSAVVGYLTVAALTRLVARVAFWAVCVGFGLLAVLGGALLLV